MPDDPQHFQTLLRHGVPFVIGASLDWLRKMKRASGRAKDQIDLDNLPE